MGLFDKFRKKQPQQNEIQMDSKENHNNNLASDFCVNFSIPKEGFLQVDFYDKQADFKQFYDTTRLVAKIDALNLAGKPVHDCAVSWYGESDAIMFDKNGMDCGRRSNYRGILAEIDLDLLRTDSDYCYMVMKGLLNQKRVEKYLDRGLQENPDKPCGKYIGGVKEIDNRYRKFFNPEVGKASHNSEFMIDRRKQVREMEERGKQKLREDKKAQIQKLEEELRELR